MLFAPKNCTRCLGDVYIEQLNAGEDGRQRYEVTCLQCGHEPRKTGPYIEAFRRRMRERALQHSSGQGAAAFEMPSYRRD